GERQIRIRVVLRSDMRSNGDTIRALPVQSTLGPPVRLDAVANVDFGLGEVSIERRDRERAVTVMANVVRGDIGSAQRAVFDLPEAQNPGAGVQLATSGDTERLADKFGSFGTALLWGLLLL